MKVFRKITAYIICICIMLTLAPFGIVNAASDIVINGADFASITNASNPSIYGNYLMVMYYQRPTYEFEVDEAGLYEVYATLSVYNNATQDVSVRINGTTESDSVGTVSCYTGGSGISQSGNNPLTFKVGTAALENGTNTLTFLCVGNNASQSVYIRYFTIKKIEGTKISKFKVGNEVYDENELYPKGTDYFTASFTNDIKDGTFDDVAVLDSDDSPLPIKTEALNDGKTVKISLKKALDFGESYTIVLSGIKDDLGATIKDESYVINTVESEDDDFGEDFIELTDVKITEGKVSASGFVKSSQNLGMSNKLVRLYVTAPGGNEEFILETLSETDGAFDIKADIKTNTGGNYIVSVESEYGAKDSFTVFYVSENLIKPILENLSKTETASEVESLLTSEENKTNLQINPETDMAGLDASLVFDRLAGTDAKNAEDFKKAYESAITIERINQATTADEVENVLNNSDQMALLGAQKQKFDALTDGKSFVVNGIFEADRFVYISDFVALFNSLFNTAFVEQLGISDVEILNRTKASKKGEIVSLEIESETNLAKIKKVVLDVEFSKRFKEYIKDFDAKDANVSLENDTYTVTKTYESSIDSKSLAELNFVVDKVGSVGINLGGSVVLETEEGFDVTVEIKKDVCIVLVNPAETGIEDIEVNGADFSGINVDNPSKYGTGLGVIYVVNPVYTITVPEDGIYEVFVKAALNDNYSQPASIYVNGESIGSVTYYTGGEGITNSLTNKKEFYAGSAYLDEGDNEFKLSFDKNQGSACMLLLSSITLRKVGENGLLSLKVGEDEYVDNKVYKRETDVLKATYVRAVDESSLSGISVENEEGKLLGIKTSLSEDKKSVIIAFSEVLDYDCEYTVVLNGIKDIFGETVENESFSFVTSSESDTGIDNAEITSFVIENGVVTVMGVAKNSQGIGISGKKLEFYLTTPGGVSQKVSTTFSEENGMFKFTYSLDSEVDGTYNAKVKTEYENESETIEYTYLTNETASEIFASLKNASDAEDVREILEANQEILNIDLLKDTDELSDLSLVYNHLKGAEIADVQEFISLYNAAIALEKINQAKSGDEEKVLQIICDKKIMENLGVDADKLEIITDKEEFVTLLIAENRAETKEEFVKMFDDVFNAALAKQVGYSDITLTSSSDSVKLGQEAVVSIASSEELSNAKKISFEIMGDFIEIIDFDCTSELGEVHALKTADGYKVEISDIDELRKFTEIMRIGIGVNKIGTYTFNVKGSVIRESGEEYDVVCDILSQIYSVAFTSQPKGSGGSGGSGGGSGSSKGNSIAPSGSVSSEENANEQKRERDYIDLGEAQWAEKAIRTLYNKQILTMPEDCRFEPNRNITRAEFIKMLVLAYDMIIVKTGTYPGFSDVSENAWYYDYVRAAYFSGVIKGDENGNLYPEKYISREDMCVMISRVLKMNETENIEKFADDGDISEYAKSAVYFAKEQGIVNGVGDNTFAPKNNATRAQASKIICAMLGEDV